jgi:predicted phage terminase large subunit-like protein
MPRSGKSYVLSLLCAWALGRNPYGSIMRNSYSADLALTFSYDIRSMIQSEKYLEVFPDIKLKRDRKAIQAWSLEGNTRPSYFCAGVGGSITGKGCNIFAALDDPIKGINEAMSPTIVEKAWRWYQADHTSRMEASCPEIHVATRWTKNDPIGRVSRLNKKNSKFISIPALDANGKSFCEAIKSTEDLLDIKRTTDAMIWEAEYMQNPVEVKGLLLPAESLNYYSLSEMSGLPSGIVGFCDTADEGNNYLCSIVCEVYAEKIFISSIVYTQEPMKITEALVASQIIDSGCQEMVFESNNGGSGFARNVERILREQGNQCIIKWRPTTQNKETRILIAAGWIQKYMWFRLDVEAGSHYDRAMEHITSYARMGKNQYDDANDALTGLAELLRPIRESRGEVHGSVR